VSEVYGWIITRDVLFEKGDHREWETDATGTIGGHDTTFTKEEILKGVTFQMFDDDMNLYYEGKIVGDYNGFEPLDDSGCQMPDAHRSGTMASDYN
jgi:hypothetical protein